MARNDKKIVIPAGEPESRGRKGTLDCRVKPDNDKKKSVISAKAGIHKVTVIARSAAAEWLAMITRK